MIMDLATGEELKLSPPEFDGTETSGTTVRQAIAEVEFNTSGNYLATVAGELSARDGLLIRHVDLAGMIKGFIWAVVLFLVGIIAGPVVALVVITSYSIHYTKLYDGLAVIIDLIHSHAVSNEVEGLSRFDGTLYQYFHNQARGP